MIPSPNKVVVMLENQVPSARPTQSRMETVSGIIDYTAVVAASSVAGECLPRSFSSPARNPFADNYIHFPPTVSQRYGSEMIAFFAAEVKYSATAVHLEDYLPQVLLELIACAKNLEYVTFSTTPTSLTFYEKEISYSWGSHYWLEVALHRGRS